MITILHVISGLKVGGAEMMLHRLILNMPRDEYRHVVVALDSEGAMLERFKNEGIDLYVLDFKRVPVREFWRLTQIIRRLQPDIVQTWLYHADFIGGIAAKLGGCRRVIWGIRTTNVSNSSSRSIVFLRWLCARLSSWLPTIIICAAEASRREHASLGYTAQRMMVIHNGFDFARLQAQSEAVANFRHEYGLKARNLVVGMLGRFNPDKDQENFVRAASLIAQGYPEARFLLVGRDCVKENSTLDKWVADTGFAERFVLLGERQDVPICLAAMDCFVMPSRTEGFPNVLAEAMAMTRPCVSTNVGDAAIVIGDCGVLVSPGDPVALANGVSSVLEMTPAKRVAMGLAGNARIRKKFSMETCVQNFASLYRRVLKC